MSKKKTPSYEEAMVELQAIVQQIQDGSISVDALSEKIKRAVELIQLCKGKLRSTEEEVKKVLE